MAQFYTLEEAARVLGMCSEELKAKAQAREVRAFLDGGSWRFRVVDVDELARRRGLGSDAELRLSDLEGPAGGGRSSGELEELDLSEFHLGVAKPDLGSESAHISKVTGKKDAQVVARHRLGSRHPGRRPDGAAQPDHGLELRDHRRPLEQLAPRRFRRQARARHGERRQRLRRPACRAVAAQTGERFRRHAHQGRHRRPRHRRLLERKRHRRASRPHDGLIRRGPGGLERQRFRAQSLERADRRACSPTREATSSSARSTPATSSSRRRCPSRATPT